MVKSQLHVANIVASSTQLAWSQTYHAGGVTGVVSVRQKDGQESASLSLVGKDLLNTFESEYFTLETKSLASIKNAVSVTYSKSKDTHDISLIVSAVIQNAVYVILAGPGKIFLVRNGQLATLLEQKEDDVLSASGFLESGDIMALETLSFEKKVSSDTLLDTLTKNSVADTAEILSPQVHKEEDGSLAALLFVYEEEKQEAVVTPVEEKQEEPQEKEPEEKKLSEAKSTSSVEDSEEYIVAAPPITKKKLSLTHRQKIFLTVAFILVVVFVGTIYFSLQKKENSQTSSLFSQVYPVAQSKFQEGQGLQSLNPALSQEDFTQAKQLLDGAKGKFPAGSSEQQQIAALLDKVNAALGSNTPPQNTTNMTKVDPTTDAFLAFANKHTSSNYLSQDDSNFYYVDSTGITQVSQSGGKVKQIIQNSNDWKSLGGFQAYLGNMYVLDTSDGIDKYPVTSSGFGSKTAYFSGSTPDLSKAVSMAIDGSVWILTSSGSITKYTKGTQDSLSVTGLTQPFSSPTQIATTVDDTNVYILDNGNSRLVVLKKDGTFVAQYANSLLKSATQLDVQEASKKVYILSGGNVYELDMK